MRVQAEKLEGIAGTDADNRGGGIRERDSELLVLAGGGKVLVGLRVNPAVEPQTHRLSTMVSRRGIRHPFDLDHAVDHDDADAGRDRPFDFGDRLVVSVETETGGVDAGGERDGKLSAAADVDVEAGLADPAGDLGGQEGLARVVHLR